VPHILCGDLNSFDRADLDEKGWEAVRRHYQARGWPPPALHSLVLRELSSRGFKDSFGLAPMEGRVAMTGLLGETAGLRLPPPTCWTSNPLFRIDWLLLRVPAGCRHSLRVRRHATLAAAPGQVDVSDHSPVVLDIDLL
jgi:endonuclease/exonuclease/phosphatase family metal-dependent hydrolase